MEYLFSIAPACASLTIVERTPAGENVLMICVIAGFVCAIGCKREEVIGVKQAYVRAGGRECQDA